MLDIVACVYFTNHNFFELCPEVVWMWRPKFETFNEINQFP